MLDIVDRYESQQTLFSEQPSRMALQALDFESNHLHKIKVNIWRNHAFESITTQMSAFALFGGLEFEWVFGGYDDSLSFTEYKHADVEVLWLDNSRYSQGNDVEAWKEWLAERINALRKISHSPIILASWFESEGVISAIQSLVDSLSGVFFANLQALCDQENIQLLDTRIAKVAGTPVSSKAQTLIARKMACHWLPAAVLPPIKAIVLDLDNTLYEGVLGEDGGDGIKVTEEHKALQVKLKELQAKGVFIALVSKNEHQDVKKLFENNNAFPLQWDDFFSTEVSWNEKAPAIDRIAKELRISTDAVLFVDDNLGELLSVVTQLSSIHTVHADSNAAITQRAIEYYPGLWRWKRGDDDSKRVKDLKANKIRSTLHEESLDQEAYYRNLNVTLSFYYDEFDYESRIHELCNKTNQFNLCLRRSSQFEVSSWLIQTNACIASVKLHDRLSDSGTIAIIVGVEKSGVLHIEELCISCRALGRGLETSIVVQSLKEILERLNCNELVFHVQHGPRNQPALAWLGDFMLRDDLPEPGEYSVNINDILSFSPLKGIHLKRV